ncbi:TetR/AcrR family transcriptional regulator [Sporosarcina thermotolerans]|uniref:TetR/AcrR family transcriptional regulator n=1 Tax=Sporosarcina thermotolerans TaxID=633404 RepID=A0AAW9AHP5_9BACL|nr:TetR/AcrR family transcriptional regulator [Sporosarcina thermotolerans]MDW0118758.1 TetR/AcrR family transcriptional regulator [Sporosarcina thermotolerans]WHT48432.1 TetR/AcrR family transcriptional regulator [Sporosarcina thermotolerans]
MNERKRRVMQTAQKVIIEKGFASTSVQDILDEAKISKGTFYNYFTSKNECLIAILEHAAEESITRRRELLVGRDKSDKTILVHQILVRMHVNRELNLLPVYEAIFYSGDEELRNYVRSHHIKELTWLSGRLVDIYGIEAEPHITDCSIMILGMIQQLTHFRKAASSEKPDIEKLVHFAMRRVDGIMQDLIKSGDTLLGPSMLKAMSMNQPSIDEMRNIIVQKLHATEEKFVKCGDETGQQYTDFLLNELESQTPRLSILEVVSRSLRELGADNEHAINIDEVVLLLWKYIDKIKKNR